MTPTEAKAIVRIGIDRGLIRVQPPRKVRMLSKYRRHPELEGITDRKEYFKNYQRLRRGKL